MISHRDVVLRPIGPDDRERLIRWQSDPLVMTGWAQPQPIMPSDAMLDDLGGRFLRFDTEGHFIIEASGDPVGRIGFQHLDPRHRSVEIMIYIGEIGQMGKGYAGASIQALVRYLIGQRAVHRIELTTLAWNERAQRLYERLGFTVEGVLRDFIWFDGRWHDEIQMSLCANDPVAWLSDAQAIGQSG